MQLAEMEKNIITITILAVCGIFILAGLGDWGLDGNSWFFGVKKQGGQKK